MRSENTNEMIRWCGVVPGPAGEIIKAATVEDRLVVGAMLEAELDERGYEVTFRQGEPGGWWVWVHDRTAVETTHKDHPSAKKLWPLDSWDDKSISEINGVPGLVARGFSADKPDALRHAMLGWLREDAIREHDTGKHAKPIEVCLKCRAAAGQALPGIATRSSDPVVAAAAAK